MVKKVFAFIIIPVFLFRNVVISSLYLSRYNCFPSADSDAQRVQFQSQLLQEHLMTKHTSPVTHSPWWCFLSVIHAQKNCQQGKVAAVVKERESQESTLTSGARTHIAAQTFEHSFTFDFLNWYWMLRLQSCVDLSRKSSTAANCSFNNAVILSNIQKIKQQIQDCSISNQWTSPTQTFVPSKTANLP